MKIAGTKTKVTVGLFALAVIVLAIAGTLLVGGGSDLLHSHKHFHATFQDATGLQAGAPVRMGGLTIGRVTGLRLEFVDNAPAAIADLEVTDREASLIRADTLVTLQTQGVLGDRFVALAGGTPSAPAVADGAALKVARQLTMEDVITRAETMLTSLNAILSDVHRFTAGLPPGDEVGKTFTNLASVADSLKVVGNKLAVPGGLLDVAADPAAGAKLHAALANFEVTSEAIESVAQRVKDGEGSLGLLVNDPTLYDDVLDVMGKADRSRVARGLVRAAVRESAPAEPQELGH